ncbi:EamA family transporter [Aliidiomarina shirensis]|uniref:EamA family transporter n=1 Tax=Aliidiomarina shirensis TaxID=1048642 RepID=A0A432WXY7_9GAMM|nr:DMT family transporter [Aliidiomarina shirensis]RUO38587.1 EamA family transporter [Aliidiomarina shirensis]
MSNIRIVVLTSLAMIAFAGNSLLNRIALYDTSIDAASFTSIRLISGALILWLLVQAVHRSRFSGGIPARIGAGNWFSAIALVIYAAGFSYAYLSLSAAMGALVLFGAVQATMISHGLWRGERLKLLQALGLLFALAGLVGLFLPGISKPPLIGTLLMVLAGIAWGVYSLRGRGAGDATQVTAGNFLRAVPIAVLLNILMYQHISLDTAGFWYAVASGALASGLGYAIWYTALPALKATTAATVQLSVPVIAAIGGIVLLGEPLTFRLVLASIAILGGIALVILNTE